MKHGHINGLSYPAAYYLQITTSCYTEVLTFDLFNYIKNHNIWYLSGAFPAVNQALAGRWIDLSLAWTHSRTLHGAHTWESSTFMIHYLNWVDRKSARTPVLIIYCWWRKSENRPVFVIPYHSSHLHGAVLQLALPGRSAHFSVAGCRCSSRLCQRWLARAERCWCCQGRWLPSAAGDSCSGTSTWHFGPGTAPSTGTPTAALRRSSWL